MAKRYRQSKLSFRRSKRRRRSRRKRFTRLTNVVPATKTVKLRYVDQFNLDGPLGINSTKVFRANSIFDPDFSVGGHQPLGHDQWAVFYDHYCVIGAKITAKFVSTGNIATTDACMVGILLKDNSNTIAAPTTIMEQTNSGYAVLTNSNASQTRTIRKGYSARKFFNLKDVKDNRALVGAAVGSNPSEDAYFHVYQTPLSTADDARPIRVIVTIEYIVNLSERKSLVAS